MYYNTIIMYHYVLVLCITTPILCIIIFYNTSVMYYYVLLCNIIMYYNTSTK